MSVPYWSRQPAASAMLTLVLVLIAAQSAFGASSVAIRQVDINTQPRPVETSNSLVSSFLVDSIWEGLDGGDNNIYMLTVEQILRDLANQPDSLSQALVLCQSISVVGELASGRSGDACTFSELINAYTESLNGGSKGRLNQALANYLGRLYYDIDAIINLNNNANVLRYESGPRANCPGGGRTYNFEASWDALLSSVNPFQIGLVNEEYCAAKRLYTAWNERSNVVGAAVTACSNKAVINLFQKSLAETSNFLRTVAYNGNIEKAATLAKVALGKALRI